MADTAIPATQREFRCVHCNGKILIPRELPPTTGPCPHCSGIITSPALESEPPAPVAIAPLDIQPAGPPPIVAEVPVPVVIPSAPAPASGPQTGAPEITMPAPPPVPVEITPVAIPPVDLVPLEVAPVTQAPVDPSPIAQAPVEIQPASPAPVMPPPVETPVAREIPKPPEAPASPEPKPSSPADIAALAAAAMDGPRKTVLPPPRTKSAADAGPSVPEKAELPPKADHSDLNKPKKPQHAAKPAKQKSGLVPAMLVLLVLILLGGGIVIFALKELGKQIEPPVKGVATGDPAVNEANYIRVGWQKDAYQLLKDYVAATTAAEKVPYILNGPQLATKIEDFYGGGTIIDSDTPPEAFSVYDLSEEDRKRGLFMMIYDQPPQFDMKEFFRPLASLEVQYGVDEADLLLSTLARVGNFAMEPLRVHAFFKRTPEGLKLDWEVFAQTKYRTLQNFVELPEIDHTGVFRVFIVEDVPDKGKAVAGTRTYRVADPANTTDTARINVMVDSETGRALSLINWRNTKENRPITKTATVELKWTGEPNAPELTISRFICWEFLGLGGQDTPSTASTK